MQPTIRREHSTGGRKNDKSSVWGEIKALKESVAKLSRALKALQDSNVAGWQEVQALIGHQVRVMTTVGGGVYDAPATLVWIDKYIFKTCDAEGREHIYSKGQFVKITPVK